MFDSSGRVVGVVVLKAGINGVGFAVPIATIARFLIQSVRRDGADGQLVRTSLDASATRGFEGRANGRERWLDYLDERSRRGAEDAPILDR